MKCLGLAAILIILTAMGADSAPRRRGGAGAPRPPLAAAHSAVMATVGPLTITRDQFEERAAAGRAEYEKRTGAALTPEISSVLDRQILESLIRAHLLLLEAQRRGLAVSEREAEAQLKQDPLFQ